MRSAIIRVWVKINNNIKQQQQTLIISKMFPFFLKKKQKLNKVKIASDRTETNKNNLY